MSQHPLIKINVRQVLRERLGKRYRYVPGWLQAWIERLIHQDELNALLESNYPTEGAEFCRGVLRDLDVRLRVSPDSVMPDPDNKHVIIVSNHPLGGLDGMALIDWATDYYGVEPYFVVNDLLMAVTPLQRVFVPINKHGAQSRRARVLLDEAMHSSRPVIIFPAGLVSRKCPGGIADLEWKKMFATKAAETGRDIVPLYFDGRNSPGFYNAAQRRQKLGIKFNFEMVLLPRELFRARGKEFAIHIGRTIDWRALRSGSIAQHVLDIRRRVYALAPQKHD